MFNVLLETPGLGDGLVGFNVVRFMKMVIQEHQIQLSLQEDWVRCKKEKAFEIKPSNSGVE